MARELLEVAANARARALDIQRESEALHAQAAQASRRAETTGMQIEAQRLCRSLERFMATLAAWNGVAPTEKEMMQWIERVEASVAELEGQLAQLKSEGSQE